MKFLESKILCYGQLSYGQSVTFQLTHCCPVGVLYCMDESDAFTLQNGRKQTWFDNHRKFLPLDHPFRRNKYAFRNNRTVTYLPPKIRSGIELLREIDALGLKKVTEIGANDANVPVSKLTGWKRKSICNTPKYTLVVFGLV